MPQQTSKPAVPPTTAAAADAAPAIRIRGAAQNNLKHLNLDIPIGSFTVVTGLSAPGNHRLSLTRFMQKDKDATLKLSAPTPDNSSTAWTGRKSMP